MTKDKFDFQSNFENQKTHAPSLVQTRQGVCVLYKGRYLYSKWEPSKAILNIISNIQIPEHSVVLIFSPALWIGLPELIKKLPTTSVIATFEFDSNLYNFSCEHFPKEFENLLKTRILFFSKKNYSEFINFIQKTQFKKIVKIDFSSGVFFNKKDYDCIFNLTQNIVDQYWKNRLTLIKFARLYSKNIFKNLSFVPFAIPFENLEHTIEKPILVLAAGESLDYTIPELKKLQENFFIICVDVATTSLMENEIIPDAIVALEAQQIIEKAYIGKPCNSKTFLFLDLASRKHIAQIVNGPISFFVSEYAKIDFFDKLKQTQILKTVIKPLGSVGLVAIELALRLRKNENVPIYFSGFDFSFSCGITHARGTPVRKKMLLENSRLKSVLNIPATFADGTFSLQGKNGKQIVSSKTLFNYALLFTDTFKDKKNIFDIGITGIDLQIPKISFDKILKTCKTTKPKIKLPFFPQQFLDKSKLQCIIFFLKKEQNALMQLKDIFINGNNSKFRNEQSLDEQISELLKAREYLYIHFPDNPNNTNLQSFYNRIRIELDFFLKEINLSLSQLENLA